jgi:hypothetical protein
MYLYPLDMVIMLWRIRTEAIQSCYSAMCMHSLDVVI